MEHRNQIQVNTPRVMFAAMRSGSGKTTITCGVLAALKKENISDEDTDFNTAKEKYRQSVNERMQRLFGSK